jgi:hypothetical protein
MPEEWYFTQDGQQVGPISRDQLNKLASSGRLTPEEMVWCDGMPDWVSARSVPGLFAPRKQAASPSTAVQTYEHTERSRNRADDEEDDERYEERRRERKKKKKKKKKKGGMAPGLKIGLITGGGVLGALLLLVLILFVVVPLFSGDGSIRGSYEVSVPPGQTHTKTVRFEKACG